MTSRTLFTLALVALAGCPTPKRPTPPAAGSVTLDVGRAGATLRGVAGDGALTFAALTIKDSTILEARRGSKPAWETSIAGSAGPLVRTGAALVATLGGTGSVAGIALRGGPGAVVVAIDPATGQLRWKLAIDSSEWSIVTAIAAAGDDVIVGGSFSGTLRVGSKIVSSAGKSDGFVARIAATGSIAWLVRVGGAGADAVQGVATSGDRIAIAGTFAAGAELAGEVFKPFDERSPYADVFVAELDANGARKWSDSFGGKLDDTVAGVAIDGQGRVAVAANARDTIHVGGVDIVARGPADGLVAFWGRDGGVGNAVALGGSGFDGTRAIVAVGDHVVVAGFFEGTVLLGSESHKSGGGDDGFLAELDGSTIVRTWMIAGAGREEVTALSAVPGGFIAGVAHTAGVTIDGAALPAPQDPLSGAAIVVRALGR